MPTQAIRYPSFIKSVSYNTDALTIEFTNGSRFRYFGCPMTHYVALCQSQVPGRYYVTKIKGKYNARKLERNQA